MSTTYRFSKPTSTALTAFVLMFAFISKSSYALNLADQPLFLTQNEPPLVMLTMGRDHRLYYEAYNDASDLNGDGVLDYIYKPAQIDYYGYFDSLKCYTYDGAKFIPSSVTTVAALKRCTGTSEWSGDWLNYNTMTRMDTLRKVLYGGTRSTDTGGVSAETILERSFIPQDSHTWAKKYESVAVDGYDIQDYTPLGLPNAGQRHLFGNVTLNSVNDAPFLRVLTNVIYQPWEWASIERPVLGNQCATGNNSRQACTTGGGGGGSAWTTNPDSSNGLTWSDFTRTTYDLKLQHVADPTPFPANHIEFNELVTNWALDTKIIPTPYLLGSDRPNQSAPIECTSNCNPGTAPNTQQDNFMTIVTGEFKTKNDDAATGLYRFFINGDDAVDMQIIDAAGLTVARIGYYGGHGFAGSDPGTLCADPLATTSACYATATLTKDTWYKFKIRHVEKTGGEGYRLRWYRPDTSSWETITGGANGVSARGLLWSETAGAGSGDFYRSAYRLNSHFSGVPASGDFDSSGHPVNRTGMDLLETTYTAVSASVAIKFGSGSVTSIDCKSPTCNPYNAQQDKYLTVISGSVTVSTEDDYKFAVDGDDSVELLVDGNLVAGKYGAGGFANNTNYAGVVHLTLGSHTIEYRHMESTGGDGYKMQWQKSGGGAAMTDYIVRVKVCDSAMPESNCKTYAGSTSKPTGLLHKYGEGNGMYFGLLSGSFINNTKGGVLRRAIGSIEDELNTDGTYKNPSTSYKLNGIIATIDRLRIDGFNYASHAYENYDSAVVTDSCGWITTSPMTAGKCQNWGSPLGEMIYEVVRYFSGKASPTTGFSYSSSDTKIRDNQLGLALATWSDPYRTTGGYPYCSKPYALLINDVYPSFDSDSVPGSKFCMEEDQTSYACSGGTTFTGDLSGLDVETEGTRIWNHEFGTGTTKSVFIGQAGAAYDNAPTPKSVTTFGNLRGLAPSDPTRQGSYTTAEVAHWAKRTDLSSAPDDQKLSTFSVALAAPLPEINVPVGSKTVNFVPFAKSVGGSSINAASNKFQPTNQIVDFYIESIKNSWKKNISGSEVSCLTASSADLTANPNDCDSTVNSGRPYYKFRINYEDVEQGADHDMDAIATYEVFLNANDTISVKVSSDYAAGGMIQHMGYVVSGGVETDAGGTPIAGSSNGIYLNVRDSDTGTGSDPDYFLDTPNTAGTALPLNSSRYFKADSTSSAASLLKDPLWLAAKYGGFSEDGVIDNLPDSIAAVPANPSGTPPTLAIPYSSEWDADADGVPDNYFLVVNPLKLEDQLGKALEKIKKDAGSASALATNSQSYLQGGQTLYQAKFSSEGWGGELNAFSVATNGTLTPITTWAAHSTLSNQTPSSRMILTYDKDLTAIDANGRLLRGIPFKWASMTTSGALQNALNMTMGGTTDTLGADRVSYLRGDVVTGMRDRPLVKGTNTKNLLGDIVNSALQYVGAPAFGYSEASYGAFYDAHKTRKATLYVGANDGMLHGFDVDTSAEVLAYVPYALYGGSRLSKLTSPDYGKTSNPHGYFVDGTPNVGDVCGGSCAAASDWKTILVGGLNRGGQGIYALDITDPANFTEANAATTVLWEFTDDMDDATVATPSPFGFTDDATTRYGLGYTYSQPAIVRICTQRASSIPPTVYCEPANRKWVVVFGNGYNSAATGNASTSGYAMLYVLDALTGKLLTKISTRTGDTSGGGSNGLATVSPVDMDGDTVADYVYAGDMKGNMWKFDLSGVNPTDWSVAYGSASTPLPLYIAKSDTAVLQPITTPPEVAYHPLGGTMVLFGTGKYLEASIDPASTAQQTFYGIRDNGSLVTPSDRSNLQQQTIDVTNNATSIGVLNAGSASLISESDWTTIKGWYIDLPETGERVAYAPRLYGKVLYFPSLAPNSAACSFGGDSWDYFVNYLTGGALEISPFAGVAQVTTSSGFAVPVRRQSQVGISPTGTSISMGGGKGFMFKTGSKDVPPEGYGTNLGSTQGRRVAWREMMTD